ncbi:transcriptional regulator [Micromonospora sp. M71_S20]|uniref:winged helix-turn-helix domain-containing protein n=1 Tax=Micromonospora sp. M71_S20 TaxID=592872 RepID=UPI000EB0664A|nr:winged helix-turn-helix domain-containing protein [Micromonospora sp. M71_S20]RLK25140.1 transcriptional regulator [Micromonospora sp. M71_S20]
MSVVAIPTRHHSTARPERIGAVRPRSAPSVTITLDLVPGPVSPRLARLLELIGELAESGEGRLGPGVAEDRPAAPRPVPAIVDPHAIRIATDSRVVHQSSRVIPLTRIEYDLLLFLAERPRRVFTRLQLLSRVWGYEHAVARTVDVHVRRLRAKLDTDMPVVTTVYGVGLRLADEARIEIERSR